MANDLNEGQAEAVATLAGPLLILAGAGTGKTKTLTARIAQLLEKKHAYPSQVLALTFTNKAAAEMRSRVLRAAVVEFMPWLGTYHSICSKMLRMMLKDKDFGLGITSEFTIIDTGDQKRLVKEILKERDLDEKTNPPALILHYISRWKDSGLNPKDIPKKQKDELLDLSAQIWWEYQKKLAALNVVDFGDLINFCVFIFRNHPETLQQWRDKFKFILVDEYQDSNDVQHALLRLLAGTKQNICCVGDDDQSIYGWRGAQVKNILQFEKTFTNAKIIRLEQNYRSTQFILSAADALISNNKTRLGKKLWTKSQGGHKVAIWENWDGKEEAQKISAKILEAKNQGITLDSIAILTRTSAQIRLFEEEAIRHAIPYRIVGSLRFYERAEIRDANAYLRLLVQSRDDLAFRRIVNQPKRQIGKTSMEALSIAAKRESCSLFDALALDSQKLIAAGLKPRAQVALKDFAKIIHSLKEKRNKKKAGDLTQAMLDETGLLKMWQLQKEAGKQQVENLNELCRAIAEFTSLEDYLEHIALVIELEESEAQKNKTDRINMMTLHAAKGLEFDNVFLPGWEEDLLPHQRSLDEPNDVEEERRLAYVGLTRARETAVVSFARARLIFNEWSNPAPSRFIAEMGKANVAFHPCAQASPAPAAPVLIRGTPTTELERVHHDIFGEGTIKASSGDNLSITFDDGTRKTIKASFVRFI